MRFRLPLLLLVLLVAAAVVPSQAQPIVLDNPSDLDRTGEPVTLGVPYPPGVLAAGTAVGVQGPDGRAVLSQAQPMARWNDGSVRWLQVSFAADVAADAAVTYRVQPGASAPAGELTVTETAAAVTVTTGPLRFTVSTTQGGVFDQIWLDDDGDRRYTDAERLLEAPATPVAEQAGRTYRAASEAPTQVTIEEAGPARVVLKLAGRHADGGDVLLKYETRIYAYAGQPFVTVRHSYANGTSVATLGDSGNPALGEQVDRYRLPLALALDGPLTARLGATFTQTLGAGDAIRLVQDDRALRSQPFRYRVQANGAEVAAGARADGLAQLTGARRGVTVAVRYFWQKNPKGIALAGDGRVTLDLLPSDEFLWPGMGTGDEVLLHFHRADAAAAAWTRARTQGLAPLLARTTPQQYIDSDAFYALQAGPSAYPEMDAYFDLVTTNHITNRDALDLYGNLHFGDVPRGQYEIPDELDVATWGNNYYDAALTAARRLAQTGDVRYAEVLVPMMRHWMETAAWNPYDADDWMRGYSPAYGIHHRGTGHFQHHYGEGVWAYYYLTGDARAREVGLRAADAIVDQQGYANQFVSLREAYQRGSAVLEAWKHTRDPRYLDHARLLIGRILSTQDEFGLVGNVGEGGVGGEQTFMMALFADTVWKLAQELPTPDPALADALARLADFADQHARKRPGAEDYWNFWPAPGGGPPTPQALDNPDATVYWTGRALLTGLYAYAYDLTGDVRYQTLARRALEAVWAGIDYQGAEFWGKASCLAAKNVLHAAALVAPETSTDAEPEDLPPATSELLTHYGAYPNPVLEEATVAFDLTRPAQVHLVVYDLRGRAVLHVPARTWPAGTDHRIGFDVSGLPVGVYVYRLVATNGSRTAQPTGRLVRLR